LHVSVLIPITNVNASVLAHIFTEETPSVVKLTCVVAIVLEMPAHETVIGILKQKSSTFTTSYLTSFQTNGYIANHIINTSEQWLHC